MHKWTSRYINEGQPRSTSAVVLIYVSESGTQGSMMLVIKWPWTSRRPRALSLPPIPIFGLVISLPILPVVEHRRPVRWRSPLTMCNELVVYSAGYGVLK